MGKKIISVILREKEGNCERIEDYYYVLESKLGTQDPRKKGRNIRRWNNWPCNVDMSPLNIIIHEGLEVGMLSEAAGFSWGAQRLRRDKEDFV